MASRFLAACLVIFFVPIFVFGATATDTPLQEKGVNAYLTGATVHSNTPLLADLLAIAGTLVVAAPVAGDALLLAGTIDILAPISGDVRAAAWRVAIEGDVHGDIAAVGGVVSVVGKAKEVRAAGGTVELRGGASGPVTIYGSNVYLSGEFAEDVRVVASDHVTLGEGTVIRGAFSYNAPQEAGIPDSATTIGGVIYTGSSSFLPTAEEARAFALAGVGVFFAVRLVAGALAAGLIVGLFPALARRMRDEILGRSWKHALALMVLGCAVMVVTPVLILFLVASFVGIGIAALIGAIYVLALLLSYLYAALLAGTTLVHVVFKRFSVSWKSAVLGMAFLYGISLIPGVGFFFTFILTAVALGALARLFYRCVYGKGEIG